jgi:hypothetical protein
MHERIVTCLKGVTLGAPQTYRNLAVIPLTDGDGGGVTYISLSEALEGRLLSVTEVSQGGSVPELKVTNSADTPVLLLDGEELAGAKQNRVLNTTVLVPEKQTLVIPVSCTEQGRWAYATPAFYDSGTIMAHSIRSRKSYAVSASLSDSASFRSNQGEVWDLVSSLQEASRVSSATGAMRDVFESHRGALDEAAAAFPAVAGQIGILVVRNGEAIGFDLVSRAAAYGRVHGRLVRSYVMDALVGKEGVAASAEAVTMAGRGFIDLALGCEEKVFKSVGYGDDHRFKGGQVVGSALIHNDTVIHTSFFLLAEARSEGRMAGMNRRRSYRVD